MRLAALLIAASLAIPALAAERPALQPVPEVPPPPGMVENVEPEVNIRHRGEEKVEEYRVRGRLYMIKVTPSHGKPYYLVDQRGDSQFRRYDDLSPNFQVPLWVILEF